MSFGGSNHVLLGPFWARVARCSDSDVEQLNFFDDFLGHGLVPSGSNQKPPEYNYGMAIILGVSELYSFSPNPLSYEQQVTALFFFSVASLATILYPLIRHRRISRKFFVSPYPSFNPPPPPPPPSFPPSSPP